MTSRGSLIRLLPATFAIQAGFHGFTAALPVALISAGYREVQIGVIVGTAFAVQMVAAPVIGAILDRVGPQRMLLVGVVAYLVATGVMGLLPLDPSEPLFGWMGARAFQGLANAVVIPAVLTLVALLVGPGGRGMWLAIVLLAQNLTLAVFPAASLLILAQSSFQAVAISIAAIILLGAVLAQRLPRNAANAPAATDSAGPPPARRPFRMTYRREWTSPLGITMLGLAYWGVIFAYLPPRAELAGTTSALFFVGYGLAVIGSRVATGWLADRYPARRLVALGLVLSTAAIALLILPPSAATLVGGGLLGGVSAGLVLSPILLELSYRSGEGDRGSAFSLFSVIAGGANAVGSIGAAPIVESVGFEAAMLLGLAGVAVALVLTLLDRSLGRR